MIIVVAEVVMIVIIVITITMILNSNSNYITICHGSNPSKLSGTYCIPKLIVADLKFSKDNFQSSKHESVCSIPGNQSSSFKHSPS